MRREQEGVDSGVGETPLLLVDGVLVKLECTNPTGSVKDRIADFMLRQAADRGDLSPGGTVVEATSGNTGIALSFVALRRGYKALIFMPEHMSQERRDLLEALGATVRLTPQSEGFEGPIRARDAYQGRDGYYLPDQFTNPDNIRCHYETTGREILRQLGDSQHLDAFVAGTGTGGTLMGVGQALREQFSDLKLVAVEPEESAVMSGCEAGDHLIQGIGDGFVPDLVDMSQVDEVAQISSAEAIGSSSDIRSRHGYCVGISAGANMAVAARLRDRGLTVATLWPDCSDRYGSLGLAPPSNEVTCPHRTGCLERAAELLAPSLLVPAE
jgi:cysteine synthase A